MTSIAVIDVEKTGINPWRHNRVVELAAVVVEPDGRVAREFVSLINPKRDIGLTCVHGIASEDVVGAP